jgi:glyoxylase-like metal-dependent hydrolase (beta-lactamase superfamily II)
VREHDVLVYPTPYTPNGYAISRWLESLKMLRALPAVAIVPGHGPVFGDHRRPRDARLMVAPCLPPSASRSCEHRNFVVSSVCNVEPLRPVYL